MGVPSGLLWHAIPVDNQIGLYMACSPSLRRKTWCRGAARRLGILSSLICLICFTVQSHLRVIDPRVLQERDSAAGLNTYSRHGREHVEGWEASKLFPGRSLQVDSDSPRRDRARAESLRQDQQGH